MTYLTGRGVSSDTNKSPCKIHHRYVACAHCASNRKEQSPVDKIEQCVPSTFHLDQTKVLDGNMVRILTWYDNEWGFSNRMLDVAVKLGKFL